MAFALPAPAPTFSHILPPAAALFPAPVFMPEPTYKALKIVGKIIHSKPPPDHTEAEFDDYMASLDANLKELEPAIIEFFPHCKIHNCNPGSRKPDPDTLPYKFDPDTLTLIPTKPISDFTQAELDGYLDAKTREAIVNPFGLVGRILG